MSKSIWIIIVLGAITALFLSIMMVLSLGQFTEIPAADWVKLAEATTAEFKLEQVAVRVSFRENPSQMRITYLTRINSKFDTSAQNAEMEKIANFAAQNYKGRDLGKIDQIQITRSETHGSGCFQQTYVAHFTLNNPRKGSKQLFPFPPRDK
ncbi:MAG: hypothetical protein HY293_10255 [Planctomycetes bacterium]|nr:hypothetical protein [Planctomycetota bacterium]